MALEDEHDQRKKIKTWYFPNEIILEILIRLPVKSILLCKTVCKLWKSLLSDPHFIKSHLSSLTCNINFAHHRLIINYKFDRSCNSCSLYDVVFEKSINTRKLLEPCFPMEVLTRWLREGRLNIIGSCNGLLCILMSHTLIIIYNPSTRIWSELPNVSHGKVYGFGYDYKVVAIAARDKVYIYSLKTGTWKSIGFFLRGHPFSYTKDYQSYESGKYSNGALHWAGGNQNLGPLNPWTIVSLDLATETYGKVLQPLYDEDNKHLSLEVLGQWLCVICKYGGSRVDVWVMKDYGAQDSWTKLVSIPDPNDCCGWISFVVPLCISNDGKLLLRSGSKLVVCDIHNNSLTQLSNNICERSQACIVDESLVSPSP